MSRREGSALGNGAGSGVGELESRLLNATLATRSKTVHWPMDANMAVSLATILASPRSFYESLLHLTTVD